ncbi:DUF6443 domain-containing protein [Flavobacterium sp. MC2016-06]|uniref:DUF6443 domain-containing protein n=1 Tax=Flavobacterium sp. MC2016-06 TaxID=2676308 RepID=UPI00209A78E5|nr:DUF6443 domain-containing protein [Flavobacterium sp. MC2016-06]
MKKITNLLLVLFPILAIAQTQTQNYVKTVNYKTATPVAITNPTPAQATQNTTYFDGLGRPIQQISGQQSNSGNDIITYIKYDSFGRQVEEYLPFKSSSTNMAFDSAAESNVLSYYASPNPAINGNPSLEATINPFSRKELENSPLNRVLKQAAPGNDWKSGSGHEIKMEYQTNTANEVRLFTANTSWDSSQGLYTISLLSSPTSFYNANELYKTITYDENTDASPSETNGSTVEFKNKEGQIILKRNYATVGVGITNEKHDTYYVYDIYGNLTYVIPPKAIDLIDSNIVDADITSTVVITSGNLPLNLKATNSIRLLPGFYAQAGSTFSAIIDNSILNNLCYQYKYDNHNRLVEKKLPGKQWEFIVYDKLDRPVATGPANSPFTDITTTGWTVTKYDIFNRPVLTAWLPATATSVTRKTLQDNQDGYTSNFSETKIATTANTTIPSGTGVSFRYTNVAWPTSDYHVLTVNYYDDYNFPDAPVIQNTVADGDQAVYYNTSKKPIRLSTGNWIRITEASTNYKNEQTYTLYDAKARPVRTYTKNFLGGYTYVDSKLDTFSGQLKYTITKHSKLEGGSELKIIEAYTYSPQDRLLTQTHQIGNLASETILSNTYDELGQLISKKIGNTTQNINYTYNIRGWLTGINDINALTKVGDPKDLFAFKLNYNTPSTADVKTLYNGNIAETSWTSTSEANPIVRSYAYKYDNLNRLRTSIFKRNGTINNAYDETLTYDKNGNIMSIVRSGNNETSAQEIDRLDYSYLNNNTTNQLMKVVDNAPATYKSNGFVDSASNIVDDYSYDANGNITIDNNKNITAIAYNHLNLPTKITFGTNGNIIYLYNAAGQKVEKTVNKTGVLSVTTDYLGGFQYSDNILKFFPTAEGYVEPSGSSYRYIYQYKDHLGSIRLSYDKNLVIQEENNYYPFGLKQIGYNNVSSSSDALKYKYNGKELQDDNIGGNQLNLYDYGTRNYDPALGRWGTHDPLSDATFQPYNFANNNPIMYNDPTGMIAENSNAFASTDVVNNSDGSYTVVGAYDDGDNNIYVVNNKREKKRTGEIIGETIQPCDFCTTNDKKGGYDIFNPSLSGVTFNLKKLNVSGTARDKSGRRVDLSDLDAEELIAWIQEYYMNTINSDMPGTPYGWLEILQELSSNEGILNVKASLGLPAYTAIGNGVSARHKPIITTLRAIGNIGFGANMFQAKPPIVGRNFWYGAVMNRAGQYNQSQNSGNGYNPYFPYFGEHSYSGGYIYYGYYKQFYKQ